MPKIELPKTFAATPVKAPHNPSFTEPRPIRTSPRETAAIAPKTAPPMLNSRWLSRNSLVVT